MLKNVMPYRLLEPLAVDGVALDDAALADLVAERAFIPCESHDAYAAGFVPLIPGTKALVHGAGGCMAFRLREEEKILPPSVIREEVDERVAQIEEREHRTVRRREKAQIKDQVFFELLPRAFSRFKETLVVIDTVADLVYTDASSWRQSETALEALRDALGSLPIAPLVTGEAPSAVMTSWLADAPPREIAIGESAMLEDPAAEGARITIRRVDLDSDPVLQHLREGMRVARLAIEYDERLSATLDEDYAIKQFKLSDTVIEADESLGEAEDAPARFDADFALHTLELRGFLSALVSLYGGEARAA